MQFSQIEVGQYQRDSSYEILCRHRNIYNYLIPVSYTHLDVYKRQVGFTTIFKTNNSLWNSVRQAVHTQLESRTGVYKLICNDCECFYIGQTGRPFIKRFREHTPHNFVNKGVSIDNIKSNFTRYLITCNHSYTNFNTNFNTLL